MEKGQFWRGYRRPVLRDGVFWFAVLVGVAGIAVQSPLADWKGQTVDWVILGAEIVLTFAAAFIIVGVLAATFRGFGEGWKAADQVARRRPAPDPRPAAAPTPEPEAAGPAAPQAAPTGTAPASDRPAAAVSLEKKARVLGRAVGAARRTYRDYE